MLNPVLIRTTNKCYLKLGATLESKYLKCFSRQQDDGEFLACLKDVQKDLFSA